MSWTKGDMVKEAYSELALAQYDFDLEPEEMQTGLRRLDAIMALWELKGIRLGYPLPSDAQGSSETDDSNLPMSAVVAAYSTLAVQLGPGLGKTVTAETKAAAKDGLSALMTAAAFPQSVQLPSTMPRGQGTKPWRTSYGPFVLPPDLDPLTISPGGDLDIARE